MARISKKKEKKFWYLDHTGIMGLVSQCERFTKEGRTVAKGALKGKELGLQLAVKSMGTIFGSESAKTYEMYSGTTGRKKPEYSAENTEQLLTRVTNYLKRKKGLVSFKGVDEFLKIDEAALPLFCTASLRFFLDSKFYLESSMARNVTDGIKNGIVELIIKNKFIVLRADLEGVPLNHAKWQKVTMGASLAKWTSVYLNEKGNPEFGKTSDLALLLRTSIDEPIDLGFFGHMIKAGTSLYIKPFAIWE